MFTTDRDLLPLEPSLFRDVAWSGQRLLAQEGSIVGNTLTLLGTDLAALGVTTGHVVTISGTPYEVIARPTSTTLTISRPRAFPTDPILPPSPGTELAVEITTFAPQRALAHAHLRRAAGLDPAGSTNPGAVTTAHVLNQSDAALAEALAALHLIFSAAAILTPDSSPLNQRAAAYALRARAELRRLRLNIDLNADGAQDATRALGALFFERA